MDFYIFIVIVVIAIGLWNLMIAILGLFPRFLSTATGTLTNAKTKICLGRTLRVHFSGILP